MIKPGDPAGFLLQQLVSGKAKIVMPPVGARGTERQVLIFNSWIEQGALRGPTTRVSSRPFVPGRSRTGRFKLCENRTFQWSKTLHGRVIPLTHLCSTVSIVRGSSPRRKPIASHCCAASHSVSLDCHPRPNR